MDAQPSNKQIPVRTYVRAFSKVSDGIFLCDFLIFGLQVLELSDLLRRERYCTLLHWFNGRDLFKNYNNNELFYMCRIIHWVLFSQMILT